MLSLLFPVHAAAQALASADVAERTRVATYYVYSDATLGPVVSIVEDAYAFLSAAFGVVLETPIEVHLFPTQTAFWNRVFPGRENNGRTTGYADAENGRIYLTSPDDTSIKSREEMLKVPLHELTHLFLPHTDTLRREGAAVSLADQLTPAPSGLLPITGEDDIVRLFRGMESSDIDSVRAGYNLAGWRERFVLEECLDGDYRRYLSHYRTQVDRFDWSSLGYPSEVAFYTALSGYIRQTGDEQR